jgi:hypothetical protein
MIMDTLQGGSNEPAVPVGRADVSQQMAFVICKQQGQSQLGRNLLQVNFDQRSSRYNEDLKMHTIFADLIVKGSEREPIYIRCDISAVNRQILEYRIKGMTGFGAFNN